MSQIYFVLPAYNEEDAIQDVLKGVAKELAAFSYKLVVVNDGSSDKTHEKIAELSTELPIQLIDHEVNKGLGTALKTGIYWATEASEPDDTIMVMESDGTHPLDGLIPMAEAIQGGADLSIGSRFIGQDGYQKVPYHRVVLSQGANTLYRLLFRVPGITDYTNLYRAFRASLLKKGLECYGKEGFMDKQGFEAVPDLLLKLRKFNPKVQEVEAQVCFADDQRPSSISVIPTVFNSLKLCARHLIK